MGKKAKYSLKAVAESTVSQIRKEFSGVTGKRRYVILISMALIIMTLAVYWQTGNHAFLNLDDNVYVTENPHVTTGITVANIIWAFTSVDEITSNWHPVTWLSHMADVQLYGMNPRGHHLTNVFFHTSCTVLLFLLFSRLTGALWQSAFVAAMFAIHPLHVESVAWVAERKDVLSAFFGFLSLLMYAEFTAKRKPALYLLALFSFILGLMSKPMLVTLPAVMLLLDYWPLERYRHEGEEQGLRHLAGAVMDLVKEKIPFFACSLLSAVVTIYAQRKGGAMHSLDDLPLMIRISNALIAYVKYIGKTVWPSDLAVYYPFPLSLPLWQVIGSLLVLLLLSAAAIRAGRRHPYFAVGWFWFIVTLVPVIGFIQVGTQSMADRYTYIPQTGLFIMAAWGVTELTVNVQYRQAILSLFAAAFIIISAALTWQQLGYWRDNISLFRHTLRVTDNNFVIHFNLGLALANKGYTDAAIEEYIKAFGVNPAFDNAHYDLKSAIDQIKRQRQESGSGN